MKRINIQVIINIFAIALSTIACSNNYTIKSELNKTCPIYPNYMGVTVPYNIAPLNMQTDSIESGFVRLYAKESNQMLYYKIKDHKVKFNKSEWHDLLEANKGEQIYVTFVNDKGEAYRDFIIKVANEPIDKYIAYRLIEPGFQQWSEMGLYQRDLESFKQSAIIENKNTDFSCMNCHSFGNRDANNMLFHVRSTDYAGTYIWIDGKMEKLNTKTPQTISALVYPSWHPSNKYIAFSVNDTKQTFYTGNPDKIEVFDYKSDVVVYDVEKHEMVTAPQLFSKAQFETFPTFSSDGKRLFFCSADSTQMPHNLDKVRYALCAIDFNPETREFGNKVDTIYKDIQKSATLPRVSPDGKYLLFTVGNYGNFHIWHKSSNLWLHDFATGKNTIARRWNSNDVESYHSWSSNSRWVVFSSRRDEGLHTRLYIGYIDENGEMGRPFLLPQEDPSHNNRLMKSYNIPEFVKGKIDEKGYEVRNADKGIDLKFATDIPTDMTSGASVKN